MKTDLKILNTIVTDYNSIDIYPYPDLVPGIKPLKISITKKEKDIKLDNIKFDSVNKSKFDSKLIFELGRLFSDIQNYESLLTELMRIRKNYSVIIRFSNSQGKFHYLEDLIHQ